MYEIKKICGNCVNVELTDRDHVCKCRKHGTYIDPRFDVCRDFSAREELLAQESKETSEPDFAEDSLEENLDEDVVDPVLEPSKVVLPPTTKTSSERVKT